MIFFRHNVEKKKLLIFFVANLIGRPYFHNIFCQISERKVCDAVRPDRDVDGFNVLNVGRFCVNEDAFVPATPSGVLEIIRRLGKDLT